jgi:nucleotide-binding universal stress UspA family protein
VLIRGDAGEVILACHTKAFKFRGWPRGGCTLLPVLSCIVVCRIRMAAASPDSSEWKPEIIDVVYPGGVEMKLLVGYTGSGVGKDLLKLAVHRMQAYSGEVFLVTSLFGSEQTDTDQVIEAEQDLEWAKKYLEEQGITSQTHLLVRGNSPGEDIVQFADENGIDEIIIGVKNRSKVGKILFGSTAQYVILKSNCPVTSVK